MRAIKSHPIYCTFLLIILTLSIFGMTGCGYQQIIAERGADASDDALEAAIWSLCNAMPVGAINRHFQTDEDRAAYEELCN